MGVYDKDKVRDDDDDDDGDGDGDEGSCGRFVVPSPGAAVGCQCAKRASDSQIQARTRGTLSRKRMFGPSYMPSGLAAWFL